MIRSPTPFFRTLAATARYGNSHHPLLLATLSTRRSLSTSTPSRTPALKSKGIDESATKGTEGLHQADTVAVRSVAHDVAHKSDVPVLGDWVLFHPVYSKEELKSVKVVHRDEKQFSDKFASFLVKAARFGFDFVSGYKHKEIPPNSNMSLKELRSKGYIMTEQGWLNRILFLETIAGIPGMVAATIRHLHSLRLMRRDAGWIHTLLEEAENERMHLMTFMTIRKPNIFFRALVLGAQGVFYNVFFLSYLMSPSTCHRFVGYLEEEAVRTYTVCINEIESGRFPEWADKPAPAIAKDYWRLGSDASLLDVIYAVRSDESTHRFVNHSLANLNVKSDVNPFAIREPDMTVKGTKPGFEREEAETYVREAHEMIQQQQQQQQQQQKEQPVANT